MAHVPIVPASLLHAHCRSPSGESIPCGSGFQPDGVGPRMMTESRNRTGWKPIPHSGSSGLSANQVKSPWNSGEWQDHHRRGFFRQANRDSPGRSSMKAMVVSSPRRSSRRRCDDSTCPTPCRPRARSACGSSCCAICRTDLHVIEGDLPPRRRRSSPATRSSAWSTGSAPAAGASAGHRVGDRLAAPHLRPVRLLHQRAGEPLRPLAYTGYHADGGYAEYALVPEAFAYAIPDGFDDVDAAPLLCAGSSATGR